MWLLSVVSENWNTWSDVVANAATVAAILVGGYWTYTRFIRERGQWPRASLELVASHWPLTATQTYVRVVVKVRNAGSTLVQLTNLRAEIYRVRPIEAAVRQKIEADCLVPPDSREADWPCIAARETNWSAGDVEIEPQEGDEFGHDFFVPAEVETIFIYAYIRNVKKRKRDIGWTVSMAYEVQAPVGRVRKLADKVAGRG